ncbi:winged helix DNA-binding protein [Saccharopolyspora erythraea NRRL 2338]|uniref:Uncharacterized protein n=2 Tax=Saccharopolyspora erythraea TaxID=1836 RepID=A4FF89_SACEN|nr:winged helix DNA-binding domain-containing protein [Saccharopolyspora erythraea]EQD86019.1 hypothetical protein N599_11645 [Saccharopolyspora erythraea D]PFG96437.1 winged helix DNA-binding protein [Saccharopolyspora erythraea NRRL 2338]QRK92935.1 AlkZ family DNA glycosylase [Saccharopolyspora erythraea]CAM02714.1 hypothetical protein SACE_3440 [Saccharopolyspora erythraea NRRL 2338]
MSVLTRRALNRATLERQQLLRRGGTPLEVITRLTGMQAQDPHLPYLGLWSRTAGLTREQLTRLLHERAVVRSTLHRGTQHLVSAGDYRWLRPTLQPMLDRWQRGAFGKATAGIDLAGLAAAVRESLAGGPLTRRQLADRLAVRWPGRDAMALAWSAQALTRVVHPPPNGVWGHHGPTLFTPAETWLGPAGSVQARPDELVRRYLAGFGPAAVHDIQAWCGMTRLREVVERLRPELRVLRDESGRELFDLPGAPLPGPDVPAPVRFLPELDNVVIGFRDRSRMMTERERGHVVVEAPVTSDGFLCGFWRTERGGGRALLRVGLTRPLSEKDRSEVEAEGRRLLRFAADDADERQVRIGEFEGWHQERRRAPAHPAHTRFSRTSRQKAGRRSAP